MRSLFFLLMAAVAGVALADGDVIEARIPEDVCHKLPKSTYKKPAGKCRFLLPRIQAPNLPDEKQIRQMMGAALKSATITNAKALSRRGFGELQQIAAEYESMRKSFATTAKSGRLPIDPRIPILLADLATRISISIKKIDSYVAQIQSVMSLGRTNLNAVQMAVSAKVIAERFRALKDGKETQEDEISDNRGNGISPFACFRNSKEHRRVTQMVFTAMAAKWLKEEINQSLDDPNTRWADDFNALLGRGRSSKPTSSPGMAKGPEDMALIGAGLRVLTAARLRPSDGPYTKAQDRKKALRHRLLTGVIMADLADKTVENLKADGGESLSERLDVISAKGVVSRAGMAGAVKSGSGTSRTINDRLADQATIDGVRARQSQRETDLMAVWATGALQ